MLTGHRDRRVETLGGRADSDIIAGITGGGQRRSHF